MLRLTRLDEPCPDLELARTATLAGQSVGAAAMELWSASPAARPWIALGIFVATALLASEIDRDALRTSMRPFAAECE